MAKTSPKAQFKTYVCNEYPYLKLGSALKDEHDRHITIAFGEGVPGLYTAKSAEEERFIESRDWYGVKIFPFDQGAAASQKPGDEQEEL
jgi:hypothetical protein